MREVLLLIAVRFGRGVALGWLWLASPLELATALTGLLAGPTTLGAVGVLLVAARTLVITLGLIVGLRIARQEDARQLAVVWALADLGTLAMALASGRLPSNRLPGTALIAWALYAVGALLVVVVARPAPRGRPEPHGRDAA